MCECVCVCMCVLSYSFARLHACMRLFRKSPARCRDEEAEGREMYGLGVIVVVVVVEAWVVVLREGGHSGPLIQPRTHGAPLNAPLSRPSQRPLVLLMPFSSLPLHHHFLFSFSFSLSRRPQRENKAVATIQPGGVGTTAARPSFFVSPLHSAAGHHHVISVMIHAFPRE